MNGEHFLSVPDTQTSELGPFVAAAAMCGKTGMHNPIKNPEL